MRKSFNMGSRLSDSFFLTIYYRLPVIILTGFIFWQSSYPGMIEQSLFSFQDKVLHFGAYALLAFLTVRAVKKERPFWTLNKIRITAILFTCLFGLSDEIHQAFVPTRDGSVWDFLADCAGSIAGCVFYLKFIDNGYWLDCTGIKSGE